VAKKQPEIQILPIYIQNTSAALVDALLPFFMDSKTVFIISSDFCHYGERFHYTPFQGNTQLPIFKQIEVMDLKAVEVIAKFESPNFRNYLSQTSNTICGRIPILILLQLVEAAADKQHNEGGDLFELKLLQYAQSNAVISGKDSSVSYIAAAINMKESVEP
jgi:MEMO1 family protein